MLAAAAAHVGISAASVAALCAVLAIVSGFILWSGRWTWRLGRRIWQFLDDWDGEKARPGVRARPGVLERIGSVEDIAVSVKAEMSLNGGGSMHDVLVSTAADVVQVKEDVAQVKDDVAALRARVEQYERQREERDG